MICQPCTQSAPLGSMTLSIAAPPWVLHLHCFQPHSHPAREALLSLLILRKPGQRGCDRPEVTKFPRAILRGTHRSFCPCPVNYNPAQRLLDTEVSTGPWRSGPEWTKTLVVISISGPWSSKKPGKFIAKGGGRLRAVPSPGIPPSSQPQPWRGPEWMASNRPEHMLQGLPRETDGSVSATTIAPHQSLKVIVESSSSALTSCVTLDKPPNLSELELSPPPTSPAPAVQSGPTLISTLPQSPKE